MLSFRFVFIVISPLLACFSISRISASEPRERPPLVLGVGEQRLLRVPGLIRYSLGSDAVRVHPLSRSLPDEFPASARESLLIKGVRTGMSDLWVWKSAGAPEHRILRVEKSVGSPLSLSFQRALESLMEVETWILGSGVVLRGEVQTYTESARIRALSESFPKQIRDETEISPQLLDTSWTRLQEWARTTGNARTLQITRDDPNRTIRIQGALDDPARKAPLERQIRAIFPLCQIHLSSLPDSAPTVYFTVFLLELNRNRFRSLGLNWPAELPQAVQITPWGISSAVLNEAFQLDLALRALESDGSAHILSRPELAVRAPGEAELFAGGELPIRAKTRSTSSVLWKPHGLTLRLKVTHVAGDRLRLDIHTEVSHLDENIGLDSIPGLQANRMKTQVDAQFDVPLLLSGLLQQSTREQARGLPLLRHIPVLGKLFGSEDYLNERSELVAILLPRSSPPKAPMHRVNPRVTPKGPVPVPRHWISPARERALRAEPGFPWNAFDSEHGGSFE